MMFRLLGVTALILFLMSCKDNVVEETKSLDDSHLDGAFAGSLVCSKCHEEEYRAWSGSHHDLAMQIADSSTVLGDFNNVKFKSRGVDYLFFRRGNEYYVHTEGPDGKYRDYKIGYTFGVYPLQQYLIDFPKGRKQCLLVAWDVEKKRWFDLQPGVEAPPGDWLHWTGGSMTWNSMCADCHSTDLRKNYDWETDTYHTTYSAIDVSCEACHGPMATHVEYYSTNKGDRAGTPPKSFMDTTITSEQLVDKCARCHSRRSQLTPYFDFKGIFQDHYAPALMVDPIYEIDGQIKDEVYVYGSFVQSEMYHNKISCKDCHDVHSLQLKKQGNALCLQCHEVRYDTKEHHFHAPGTEASQCVNCHMPGKMYMVIDFRRDHSIRVPRPDLTVTHQVPNACNHCHKEQTPQWAATKIAKWYGKERTPHFSDLLLAGYSGDKTAFFRAFSNPDIPDIIRATAVNQYALMSLTRQEAGRLVEFLKDSSALVRNEVILALTDLELPDIKVALEPLLLDPVRMVRISAARYFVRTDNSVFDRNQKYKMALKEYIEGLRVNADFASGQHQMALFYQAKGAIDSAINAYYKALDIDDHYNPSRINLALLEYRRGRFEIAEKLYRKVIEQEPEYSYPYYMLGLLYNEKGDETLALKYLSGACERIPLLPRAFYNYALLLQKQGKHPKSIEVLDKGLTHFPDDEQLLYVKLIGLINSNQKASAYETCQRLIRVAPNNPEYQKILEELRQ